MLDLNLKLKAHINLRMEKARNIKIRIKGILNRFGLTPNLIKRIYIIAVQSIILYGAEI